MILKDEALNMTNRLPYNNFPICPHRNLKNLIVPYYFEEMHFLKE